MHPCFFGYGSLVNRATHDYPAAIPAKAQGWRRVWRQTVLRPYAYLSVIPANGSIDGLLAEVPNGDWAALDEREKAYDRLPARDTSHARSDRPDVSIYAVPDRHLADSGDHPVLLSYIDVVLQGYLQVFGADGPARFADTTDGWDTPILDDRAAPRYPRHQRLSTAETAMVDDLLAALDARVIRAP